MRRGVRRGGRRPRGRGSRACLPARAGSAGRTCGRRAGRLGSRGREAHGGDPARAPSDARGARLHPPRRRRGAALWLSSRSTRWPGATTRCEDPLGRAGAWPGGGPVLCLGHQGGAAPTRLPALWLRAQDRGRVVQSPRGGVGVRGSATPEGTCSSEPGTVLLSTDTTGHVK